MLKTMKHWLPLIIILILMVIAFATGLHERISLQTLQDNKDNLLQIVAEHPIMTALGFMSIYIIFVALSLPAATLLTLTGGFLFGATLGTLYVVSAATIGATIIFMIAKTSLGQVLRERAGGLYKRVEGNMNNNATGYLLFMRLVPIFPFFLVNILPALFNVKPRIFILTTFFGIIPGSFVFVNLGKQLGTITNLKDLVSMQTLLAFALLGLFALFPTLYKQIKERRKTVTMALVLLFMTLSNSAYAYPQYDQFLNLYDGLLKEHVEPNHQSKSGINYNGVNYEDWKADTRHAQAKELLRQVNPEIFVSKNEKMSFWINAYNFLTITLIIQEDEKRSIKNLGNLFRSPWIKYKWDLAGNKYTLDQIEHKILRPMKDARMHFAVNCASISCPDLRNESYKANTLDQQLNEQVISALTNEGKGMRRDDYKLYVSKIFQWFAGDFNGGDIIGWINYYTPVNKNLTLKFMDYNWSLNKTRNQPHK